MVSGVMWLVVVVVVLVVVVLVLVVMVLASVLLLFFQRPQSLDSHICWISEGTALPAATQHKRLRRYINHIDKHRVCARPVSDSTRGRGGGRVTTWRRGRFGAEQSTVQAPNQAPEQARFFVRIGAEMMF